MLRYLYAYKIFILKFWVWFLTSPRTLKLFNPYFSWCNVVNYSPASELLVVLKVRPFIFSLGHRAGVLCRAHETLNKGFFTALNCLVRRKWWGNNEKLGWNVYLYSEWVSKLVNLHRNDTPSESSPESIYARKMHKLIS